MQIDKYIFDDNIFYFINVFSEDVLNISSCCVKITIDDEM